MEKISFFIIVKTEGHGWRGMCSVFLKGKGKNAVNSTTVQNVCARTALTDISSNKKQLQGTVIIQRNFIHI
jgi:hypothetical protein